MSFSLHNMSLLSFNIRGDRRDQTGAAVEHHRILTILSRCVEVLLAVHVMAYMYLLYRFWLPTKAVELNIEDERQKKYNKDKVIVYSDVSFLIRRKSVELELSC